MEQKTTKAEDYLRIVKGIAYGGEYLRNYIDVRNNPACISFYFKDKKESKNVWEDVRALIYKTYPNSDSPLVIRMLSIVSNRLDWLTGVWKNSFSDAEKSRYISNISAYPLFFSAKTIKLALQSVNINDFMWLTEVYDNLDYYRKHDFFEVGVCSREVMIKTRGFREKHIEKGVKFYVPNTYQNKEDAFLTNCLMLEYPYLSKYRVQSYKLDRPYECYISVEEDGKSIGSVYIPYECFKNKTIEPAIARMNSYFTSYYGKNTTELQKQLGLMESDTFKMLQKDIES